MYASHAVTMYALIQSYLHETCFTEEVTENTPSVHGHTIEDWHRAWILTSAFRRHNTKTTKADDDDGPKSSRTGKYDAIPPTFLTDEDYAAYDTAHNEGLAPVTPTQATAANEALENED